MTSKELSKLIEDTAESMRESNWSVEINSRLPYVAVECKETDQEYFMQGEEAQDFLDEVEDSIERNQLDVTEEDYILYSASGW